MAFSRYNKRKKKKNEDSMYFDYFETRDVEFINHYETPEYIPNEIYSRGELGVIYHTWKQGDRVYKLAEKYYKNPSLWWVICKFNNKPTENYFKEGDTIMIPTQLEKALRFMGI